MKSSSQIMEFNHEQKTRLPEHQRKSLSCKTKTKPAEKNTLEKVANVDERKLYNTFSCFEKGDHQKKKDYNKHQTYPTRNVLSKGDTGQTKSFKKTDGEALGLEC